ncbi:MAG: penicillin-binding transpeptidase domain-containing protein [Acidimicrobiia bacterium]|nr:penicillin-binding transpeptidase domain-containing protein [Acidimicrobiia bacterium]
MSLVSVEPSTGFVKALVGGRDWNASQVNLALGGSLGMQPGSSFKTFTLARALEEGYRPDSVYPAPGVWNIPGCVGEDCSIRNYSGGGYGALTLAAATHSSVNTVFAQLINDIGVDDVVDLGRRLGIDRLDPDANYGLSLTLGSAEVEPLEMASAYSVFANHGVRAAPTPVVRVIDRVGERHRGQHRARASRSCTPRSPTPSPRSCAGWSTVARARTPASVAPRRARRGRPRSGGRRGSWVHPQLATAIWMGHSDVPRSLLGIGGYSRVTGGSIPARTWASFMGPAHENLPVVDFRPPGPLPAPSDDDLKIRPARRRATTEISRACGGVCPGRARRRVTPMVPARPMARVRPAAGRTATATATVTTVIAATRVATTRTATRPGAGDPGSALPRPGPGEDRHDRHRGPGPGYTASRRSGRRGSRGPRRGRRSTVASGAPTGLASRREGAPEGGTPVGPLPDPHPLDRDLVADLRARRCHRWSDGRVRLVPLQRPGDRARGRERRAAGNDRRGEGRDRRAAHPDPRRDQPGVDPARGLRRRGDQDGRAGRHPAQRRVVRQHPRRGGAPSVGSAVVVTTDDEESVLLTSFEVVREASIEPGPDIRVSSPVEELPAELWNWDENQDLALLKVPKANLPLIPWASEQAAAEALGKRVFLLSGLGGSGISAAPGLVVDQSTSGLQHTVPVGTAFRGGPIVTGGGELLAMASLDYEPLGFNPGRVRFAVPIGAACETVLACGGGVIGESGEGQVGAPDPNRAPPTGD